MGGSPGMPSKPAPGLDIEGLMSEPGKPGEMGEPGDSMAEEGSETSLEAALESANIQATPEQLNKIKEILGIAGGAIPSMAGAPGEEDMDLGGESVPPMGGAPAGAPKFNSKLGKMFGK